jgi:hypothetical protein
MSGELASSSSPRCTKPASISRNTPYS